MGFLIPELDMLHDELVALKNNVRDTLLTLAAKETGRSQSEFVVRDIFPKDDLGFNGCEWENQTAQAANVWTRDFYKELPKSKFVGFYGIIDHSVYPCPAAASPEGQALLGASYRLGTSGTTTKEQVHLQRAAKDFYLTSNFAHHPAGYHKPVYYKGSDTISIYYTANDTIAQYAGAPELLGMVCEPFGEVISNDGLDILGYSEQTSLGIPDAEITQLEIKMLREKTKQKLLQLAVKETGKALQDFVVRDIFPYEDLGFNGAEWQNQLALSAADAFEVDWTKELPKSQFVGFYGMFFQTAVAAMAGMKYKGMSYKVGSSGATTRKQIHLDKMYRGEMTSVGVTPVSRMFHEPVIYKGTETIYVATMADATTTQYLDKIGNIGLMVEPYGPMISGV